MSLEDGQLNYCRGRMRLTRGNGVGALRRSYILILVCSIVKMDGMSILFSNQHRQSHPHPHPHPLHPCLKVIPCATFASLRSTSTISSRHTHVQCAARLSADQDGTPFKLLPLLSCTTIDFWAWFRWHYVSKPHL